ncbi:MAG TPA: hypothetical protein VIJ99_01635 [Acidimicrobiales bacterium]
MNRDTQVVVARVDEIAGILSSDDKFEDDGEVDRIVMNLAGEKVMNAVDLKAEDPFGDCWRLIAE